MTKVILNGYKVVRKSTKTIIGTYETKANATSHINSICSDGEESFKDFKISSITTNDISDNELSELIDLYANILNEYERYAHVSDYVQKDVDKAKSIFDKFCQIRDEREDATLSIDPINVSFKHNGKKYSFKLKPEDNDFWISMTSKHGIIFDFHYCEDYNQICVYIPETTNPIHSQPINL